MRRVIILALAAIFCASFQVQASMPNTLSPAEKVYGLSRFWQEVNYNFVYLYKVDKAAWNAEYLKLIEEVQQTENDYEYYRLLQRFSAMLCDGHTNIDLPQAVQKQLMSNSFGDYRLVVRNIGGRATIAMVNKSKMDEVPIGSEVVEVNGEPTSRYLEKYVTPYIASSTDYVRDNVAVMQMFRAPEGTKFNVKIKRPNSKKLLKLELVVGACADEELYPEVEPWELFKFEKYDDGVVYTALNSFGEGDIVERFKEKLPEIREAKKLIVDLRGNGGGNSSYAFEIAKYIVGQDYLPISKSRTRKHQALQKAYTPYVDASDTLMMSQSQRDQYRDVVLLGVDSLYHNLPNDRYPNEVADSGKVIIPTVVLFGNWTASSAEDFLIVIDGQEHITTMGERSYGSTGMPYIFEMPGGGRARVCTKDDSYPDGRAFVGVGVIPDIEIQSTLDEFLGLDDTTLKAALEYLSAK